MFCLFVFSPLDHSAKVQNRAKKEADRRDESVFLGCAQNPIENMKSQDHDDWKLISSSSGVSEKYLGFVIVIYIECKLSNYNEKHQPYLTSQIFTSQGHDKRRWLKFSLHNCKETMLTKREEGQLIPLLRESILPSKWECQERNEDLHGHLSSGWFDLCK